jgi:hypothetical protein
MAESSSGILTQYLAERFQPCFSIFIFHYSTVELLAIAASLRSENEMLQNIKPSMSESPTRAWIPEVH